MKYIFIQVIINLKKNGKEMTLASSKVLSLFSQEIWSFSPFIMLIIATVSYSVFFAIFGKRSWAFKV